MHLALLFDLTWQILQLSQSLSRELQVHHILSECNVLVDSQSGPAQMEWALDHSVF